MAFGVVIYRLIRVSIYIQGDVGLILWLVKYVIILNGVASMKPHRFPFLRSHVLNASNKVYFIHLFV